MTYQASIEAQAQPAELIAHALEEAEPSPLAVGWFDRGDGRFEVFAQYDTPPVREDLLVIIAGAVGSSVLGPLNIEELAPADWVTVSQGKRPPVQAGRFFVHGSHDRERAPQHRFVIEIDAGQAFGTAHHATTRGCLLALDVLIKRRLRRSIVDIGTGTGILAIAAAHAVKRKVLASDRDSIAVQIARENAAKNCALGSVRVTQGDGFAHPGLRGVRADLLLANLLERAHRDLAPDYAKHVVPGGTAVLSGLTETQARNIEARTRSFGFVLERRIILDGWATLVITRRSTRPRRD